MDIREALLTLFETPNAVWVLSGAALLGLNAGILGCFAFLRKRALVGDTLAHAALPGVAGAFLIFQSRSPLVIVGGAMTSALAGMGAVEWLKANTKLKEDSILAVVLSLFFGVGVLLLTVVQKLPTASQAGLDRLLFGQAASLVRSDVTVLAVLASATLCAVAIFYRRFKMVIFDPIFSRTSGVAVKRYDLLLALLLVMSVVIGIQLVGVVLVAALMLTPAAAARYWTDKLWVMLGLAGLFGAVAGVSGTAISCVAPRMPTGPWMVIVVTTLFAVSLIFAPRQGALPRFRRRRALSNRINEENVLRTIFKAEEEQHQPVSLDAGAILQFRKMNLKTLRRALQRLSRGALLTRSNEGWSLTASGRKRAGDVTRRHRLWELYLTRKINLAPDHVHLDAEEIEHMLTPEMEEQLYAELGEPSRDPHGRAIPK